MKLLSAVTLLVVFLGVTVLAQGPVNTQKPKPPTPASLAKTDDGPSAPARSAAEIFLRR
jgi:hypothetical protein